MSKAKVAVEIWSDIMCPWCAIGYAQFAKAVKALDGEIEVEARWMPFELNPEMPPEGKSQAAHIGQVYQRSPAEWVVTARGLNGNTAAQSYSNKLLVLIDGRPVYTPLFSGVYWDMPDLVPDSIDRIEVISGPGATLWGANAVNGVINVITRDSSQLDGFYADLRAGPDRQLGGVRIGGSAGRRRSSACRRCGSRRSAPRLPPPRCGARRRANCAGARRRRYPR